MLELGILPGRSVGPFSIGQPIGEVLSWLVSHADTVDHVDFLYNGEKPFSGDIVLKLSKESVIMKFDSKSQRLREVEITHLSQIKLQFRDAEVSGPATEPTFVLVYKLFGPSHPGEYSEKQHRYLLHYPGMTVEFPIPSKHQKFVLSSGGPPLEFPDGTTPVAEKIRVYGTHEQSPNHIVPSVADQFYLEEITAVPFEGLDLSLRNINLRFGQTTQDVLAMLGAPSHVFYKQGNHLFEAAARSNGDKGLQAYFFNYRAHGFDVMFDAITHRVVKFVLHTNIPDHVAFNEYRKCNFRIPIPAERRTVTKAPSPSPSPSVQPPTVISAPPPVHTPEPQAPPSSGRRRDRKLRQQQQKEQQQREQQLQKEQEEEQQQQQQQERSVEPSTTQEAQDPSSLYITADSTFHSVQQAFGEPGRPVVCDMSSNSNPFGATLLYPYSGIVFEVLRNQHIVSVCLTAPQAM